MMAKSAHICAVIIHRETYMMLVTMTLSRIILAGKSGAKYRTPQERYQIQKPKAMVVTTEIVSDAIMTGDDHP